jgi:hypothetical protein
MSEATTDLEKKCTECDGARGFNDPEFGWIDCPACEGAGYVPTEMGSRILRLIRHNKNLLVRARA